MRCWRTHYSAMFGSSSKTLGVPEKRLTAWRRRAKGRRVKRRFPTAGGEPTVFDCRERGSFYQSEFDTPQAYADREHRLTGDSVVTNLDVSPIVHFLEGCEEVWFGREKLLRRNWRSMKSDTSPYSAYMTQSSNCRQSLSITFKYETVIVESFFPRVPASIAVDGRRVAEKLSGRRSVVIGGT